MIVGIPKEVKIHEYRVALTPEAVGVLVGAGHRVLVEACAGLASGFDDKDYQRKGATIIATAQELYAQAELVVKVKEPLVAECAMIRPGQILFAFLHLAANPQQARLLVDSGASCIAFETYCDEQGHLPLLAPMSEIAGRLAVQAGALYLQREMGGRGVLLSGATGVAPGNVVVVGGGTVGMNAARIAIGLGAEVTVLDVSTQRREQLCRLFDGKIRCLPSTPEILAELCPNTDILVGAVLVPGDRAPKVITRAHIDAMPKGSVFVDVAIDQGGCGETSRVTSYDQPTYVVDGVIHYCVGNLPAAVPRTATQALSAALLPAVVTLASGDLETLIKERPAFLAGLNVHSGQITNDAVRHGVLAAQAAQ